jgi:HTH-type transcriptional regulator/antitoxin HigA
MASPRLIRYAPDYTTSPGEVLEEHLLARGMTKVELAVRCGRPSKTISEIIHGKAAITAETALQLERVLGVPASLWQNLEANYRLHLAKESETNAFQDEAAWARRFPHQAMVKSGHIDKPSGDADLVKRLLRFFGVGTVSGWQASFGVEQVAYRRSPAFAAAPESVAAWIRLGEIRAAEIATAPFNKAAFKRLLAEIRRLTAQSFPDVEDQLVELCASAGVAVVLVPELPKTHLSGIARWLTKDKALIQLSMRYKTGDHLWFSFFHEAGHIFLHGKKTVFIDAKGDDVTEAEQQANEFASSILIPPRAFAPFRRTGNFSIASIKKFASKQGIAPGIVVGRLQHDDLISYARRNGLKERLDWA